MFLLCFGPFWWSFRSPFAPHVAGVKHEHSLHLVRYRPPTTTASPAATTASTGGAYASQPQGQGMPQQSRSASLSGSGSSFGFGGNGGAFGSANGGAGGMFGGMDMNAMLESPAMQALLNDENLMNSMIENHPQLRQLMESNPEMGHALRNPALMREAMNAMRNPAAMQEMQRNADRALLSIENHPEGWRMLQSMYHQLDGPLSDPLGTISSTTTGNDQSTTQETSGTATRPEPATPNANALPNPWASRGRIHPLSLTHLFVPHHVLDQHEHCI